MSEKSYLKYLEQPEFREILQKARQLKSKVFSDILDGEGNQYVDLVQEGGGVLGIALVGYTYVLEEAGIRFSHLAGTSAGAINTLVMAGIGTIEKRKSEEILQALAAQNLFDFVDGDPVLKKLLQRVIDGTPLKKIKWSLLWNLRKIKSAILDHLGLNPGNQFETWLKTLLENSASGIKTIGELLELRQKDHFPASLHHRHGIALNYTEANMHIITADITTQTKVQFPKFAPLYWGENFREISPARMVRASMSVPFFFIPFEITGIPGAGGPATPLWHQLAGYKGTIPPAVKFVDGGMISNFPINVFHNQPGVLPNKPTFGVKLSVYREQFTNVDDIGSFIGSMVSTMRHDGDIEFLINNPDFNQLICYIDADKDFNWLNFNMPEEKKQKLFLLGAQKALDFLETFDWEAYKKIRVPV